MQVWNPAASFTRPNDTTAYATGDLVANSVTAANVTPMSISMGNKFPTGMTRITRARLSKSGTTAANANFRIHLYETSPTPANGDNGTWSTDQAVHWLGNIDVGSMLAFSDGCTGTGSAAAGSELFVRLSSGSTIFALLEARTAYTPAASEVFTVILEDLDSY